MDDLSGCRSASNKYQRRAVPVSLLMLRNETKNFSAQLEFIEPLMTDPERKVQQGLGWFLREAWKKNKTQVEKFLLKWKDTAPRTIFQYATEKMTPAQRKRFRRKKP